jgi:hypothetical protein
MPLVLIILCIGFAICQTSAAVVVLEWNANVETNLAGYRLYSGAVSRNYKGVVDVGRATNHTNDYILGEYFLAVTAYDTDGLESDFSNELSLFIVAPPLPRFESNTLTWVGSGSWRVRWITETSTNQQIVLTNRVVLGMFPAGSVITVQRYELGATNVLSDFSAPINFNPPATPSALRLHAFLEKSSGVDQPFVAFAEQFFFDGIESRAIYRVRIEISRTGIRVR